MKPLFDENWLVMMSNEEVQMLRVAVSKYMDMFEGLAEGEAYKRLYMDLTHILELRPW